jgi:transcription elongation factor GreA
MRWERLRMHNKLTRQDVKELQDELDYRSGPLKTEIAHEKMEAAAHGDRSENAEYKEACHRYYDNQSRMEHICHMLNTAVIIDGTDNLIGVLNLGDVVQVRFIEDDEVQEVHLTTVLQADPEKFYVSIESPLGAALYRKKVGTTVRISSPNGDYSVKIEKLLK